MRHVVTVEGEFPLESGATLRDVRVAVRTWGRFRTSATLICHALTGTADADDWWSGLFGPRNVFDPARSHVVSMDVLGGCAGTTGPTSVDPATGRRYGRTFPEITIRDMVRLQAEVLDRLRVSELELVIGGSMGGMQALEWAAMYPERVRLAVPIAVGAAQSPWAIAMSDAQRHAIAVDPLFADGDYEPDRPPKDGLGAARMMAMATYRSHASFDARFARSRADGAFAVQSWLQHHGRDLGERFDANSYLRLIGAMDSHDLGRGRGPREAIVRRMATRTLVVGITSDVLYPLAEVQSLAEALPRGQFAVIDSPHGHDAFLIDTDQLSEVVLGFIEGDLPIGRTEPRDTRTDPSPRATAMAGGVAGPSRIPAPLGGTSEASLEGGPTAVARAAGNP